MKAMKKITALVLALIMAFGMFAMSASAASKKAEAPISIDVKTSTTSNDYLGVIIVTVTVTNTSSEKVNNIVVSSCESEGLVMCKPILRNVIIANPGEAVYAVGTKSNAMTTCLLPGGILKYSYAVLMDYDFARDLIPESTHNLMRVEHKLLNTMDFVNVSTSAKSVSASEVLTFGDIDTNLVVNAYYSVSNSVYNSIG